MHEGGGHQRAHRHGGDDPRGPHDAQLPVAVDAAGEDGRAERHDDDVDRGNGTGQRVVAVLGAHQQDRGQTHHRHREAQNQPGSGKLPGRTVTQNVEIGTQHPPILSSVGGRQRPSRWGVANPLTARESGTQPRPRRAWTRPWQGKGSRLSRSPRRRQPGPSLPGRARG